MHLTPDEIVFWRWGAFSLNLTIVATWGVMAFMVLGSWLVTRRLSTGTDMSRWQNLLEVVVDGIRSQIAEVTRHDPLRYLPFVGTLFLFIAVTNTLSILPGYEAPTGSLSTTAALALCVFLAVPLFGVEQKGVLGYFRVYAQPSVFMLPFNLIGEVSRTLALAVRLFGNVMSGAMIVGILLAIARWFVPIVMMALGLLTGLIQAYIFAMLAMVYIGSATRTAARRASKPAEAPPDEKGAEPHG
jgi:F-type H+-transporting ATPase subunit a